MTSERHQEIMRVLAEALDRAQADRAAFLDRACAADDELRRAVDTLIARQDAAAQFLETSVANADGPSSIESSAVGQILGAYCVEEELGRGGMGAVYAARRADDEFEQQVAIKLINRGMDTDAIQRRFRRERQILANLNHHYIARLYDGGTTPDGLPYLVMERVTGERIDRYADRERLDTAARIALFLKVCDAVQHAHDRHVVHGDIKPANILVTPDGSPKLLDFGIARIVNPSSRSAEAPTGGWRVMTPEYASPEQLRAEPIGTSSDVYSLGAVLADLLGTRTPGGDLGAIVATALRPEISRRYASVGLLADDLRRYLAGRPIQARKDTSVYRARVFFRRHQAAAISSVAIAVCFLLLGGILTLLAIRPTPAMSIAVLPLAAASSDQSSEVLSEGMTDSLIKMFGHLGSLTIPAHDSVMRFKHQAGVERERDAARALKVGSVLSGTIASTDDRLVVDAALFDARQNARVWTHRYEAAAADILSLQEQIVRDVAGEIGVELSSASQTRAPRRYTENAAAYRDYILGRYYWNFRTFDMFNLAIPHFQAAIAADPQYALAYSGLADCYGLTGAYFNRPPHEAFPAAKTAALKALAIDDSLAEAHTSLALTTWLYDWDWDKADREFRRAIALDDRYVTAHHWYGLFLGEMGRSDEAIAEMFRAQALDPMSAPVYGDLGRVYFWARQYDKAREFYHQAFDMGAGDNFRVDALDLYEQIDHGEYLQMQARLQLGQNYLAILRTHGVQAMWQQVLADRGKAVPADVYYAVANFRVGRTDEAFRLLYVALDQRDHRLSQLRVNPSFDAVRGDPRFQDLLRRMHLD